MSAMEKVTNDDLEKVTELGRAIEAAQVAQLQFMVQLRARCKAPAGWLLTPAGEWSPPGGK